MKLADESLKRDETDSLSAGMQKELIIRVWKRRCEIIHLSSKEKDSSIFLTLTFSLRETHIGWNAQIRPRNTTLRRQWCQGKYKVWICSWIWVRFPEPKGFLGDWPEIRKERNWAYCSQTLLEIGRVTQIMFRVLRTFEPEVKFVTWSRRRRKTRIGHTSDLCLPRKEIFKAGT